MHIMKFFAHHGYYDEEQKVGNYYTVDVVLDTNFGRAAMTDTLEHTINYETIYTICAFEMRKKYRLLETLGTAIVSQIKHQFGGLAKISVTIRKLNPPLGGIVAASMIQLNESYTTTCGRCGRTFVCYSDQACWCMESLVTPKTLEMLKTQYKKCLCKECLGEYAMV